MDFEKEIFIKYLRGFSGMKSDYDYIIVSGGGVL